MNKALLLRRLFQSQRLLRTMGGHNGLSAKLAERNGFDAVWASSFEISTSYGLPDASILTMTEYLEVARSMNEVVSVPIIADCDSGFGDAPIVAHLVRKYEAAGIAAVCIEDKPFPKTNSFIPVNQSLVTVEEFSDKIRAGCEARQCPDFIIIARTEALIAGFGVHEALRRAHAYVDAGADMILIHSKKRSPDEVFEFAQSWGRRTPLIAVPTTYYQITAEEAHAAGFQMLIYANHAVRSATRAMGETMAQILAAGTTRPVESAIASMEEIFDLQGMAETRRLGR